MRMRRHIWAILASLSILFSQGALAAYACPALLSAAGLGTPCDQMDMDSGPLCERHCAEEKQKPHDGVANPPAAQFVIAFTVRLPDAPCDQGAFYSIAQQAPPPPLILCNCCLRI